jgi:hypothetical protein
MELLNILLVVVFIVFPLAIGVWALLTRRDVLRRGAAGRRRMVATGRPAGGDAHAEGEVRPPRDWASHVRPIRQHTPQARLTDPRRRFYPPRYGGRSKGIVARVTPRAMRHSFRLRAGR